MTIRFQSRPDGEYRLCPRCEKLGYGADAWHPATCEYYPVVHGRVSFARCRACITEITSRRYGVVPADETARAA